MDSVTQAALGAAVGVAVLGRRTPVWKAALAGAVCGTLPDLDALVDHGDPVSNMTFHRAESHALFWLTLASAPIGWVAARLAREPDRLRRWWLAVWLALVTHPLLDALTIYGTQLWLPFSDRPVGLGSVFVIDPLVTLPLLVGVIAALTLRAPRALAWNRAGLALGCAYLAWSVVAQAWVRGQAVDALHAQGVVRPVHLLVTPAPFNTLLWRVVAVSSDGRRYVEGFRSLLDPGDRPWRFDTFDRGSRFLPDERLRGWHLNRMLWFTRGHWKLERRTDGALVLSDLRMGQEPSYVFTFRFPPRGDGALPQAVGGRLEIARGLRWLGPRMFGADLPPPR
jgi:inner membrane protein